jgi:CheY-like chemotaxis protein
MPVSSTGAALVPDGEQAMRYLRREGPHVTAPRPHLVLLDLRLPRLDGSGVLRAIRRDPALTGLVVAVLGRADLEGALLQQQGLKADAYLDRPVRFEDVARLVRQVEHLELMFVRVSGSAPRS